MLKKFFVSVAFLTLLSTSVTMQAQSWDYSLTMSIGNASGNLGNKTGLNNSEIFNSFGAGFQSTNDKWLLGVNFRQYAGVNWAVSTIPHKDSSGGSVSAAGTYENRMRKSDALGLDVNVGYLVNLGLPEQYYTYVGARIQQYTYRQVDLGSREVWASTSSLTSSSVIVDDFNNKKMGFSPMVGIGYNFNNRYFGQMNLISSKFNFSRAAASGMITELSFGIKF